MGVSLLEIATMYIRPSPNRYTHWSRLHGATRGTVLTLHPCFMLFIFGCARRFRPPQDALTGSQTACSKHGIRMQAQRQNAIQSATGLYFFDVNRKMDFFIFSVVTGSAPAAESTRALSPKGAFKSTTTSFLDQLPAVYRNTL